jgi:hypothetical protein
MIFELSGFVSDEQLEYIKNNVYAHLEAEKNFTKYGSYRDGDSFTISNIPELKELDTFLYDKIFSSKEFIGYINRRFRPIFPTADTGYEFHRYYPGDIAHLHADNEVFFNSESENSSALLRFASVVLHLNTPSSGGDLVFPHLNKTVKTEAGKIVVFPPYGFAQHYTTPSEDCRDVLVTWFVYDNISVYKK